MRREHRKSFRPERAGQVWHQSPARRQIRRDIARRTVRSLLQILTALVVVLLILVALYAQPFEVQDVSITGLDTIPRSRIEPLVMRLIGQNLFRAKTGAVRNELLTISEVKEVRIHRTLSRKMVVSIVERKPFAAVPRFPSAMPGTQDPGIEGGHYSHVPPGISHNASPTDSAAAVAPTLQNPVGYTIIDATGLGFRSVSKLPADVVVFRDLKANELPLGKRLDSHVLADLRHCLEDCQGAKMPHPHAVRRDPGGGVTVVWGDGLIVRLGPDHWKEKLLLARKTLAYIKTQGKEAAAIDLRSLEAPVWRPREGNKDESSARPHSPSGGATAAGHRAASVEGEPG